MLLSSTPCTKHILRVLVPLKAIHQSGLVHLKAINQSGLVPLKAINQSIYLFPRKTQ